MLGWSSSRVAATLPDEVYGARGPDVSFYGTTDPTSVDFLTHYGVSFIYLGQLERNCYTEQRRRCIAMPARAGQIRPTRRIAGIRSIAEGVTIYQVVGEC